MRRQWFWLEDQPDTVADLRVEIDRHMSVKVVATPAKLVRALLEVSIADRDQVGLILDVMLMNNPMLTCPAEWYGGGSSPDSKASFFFTDRGYDAGLVFYERFMLPNAKVPKPPFLPPPVVFLTVVRSEMLDFTNRFAEICRAWGALRGVPMEQAKVKWARKWDANGLSLLKVLQDWEDK